MAWGLIKDFSKGAVAARNRANALKAQAARSGYGRTSRWSSNVTPQSAAMQQRVKAQNEKAYAAAYNGTSSGGGGGGSLSYAGGAGAGGSGAASNMKASWQKAYDEARAANKARENELRQKYKDRYSSVMGDLKGMGDQTRKDIQEQGRRREGEAAQSAISRGLSMGTVADSLQNSVREGTDRSIGQLDESIRNTKLGYESSLRKDEADFIERITDQYPDQRMYANMFQQYGQGQAGAGQAGFGGVGSAYGGFGAGGFGGGGGYSFFKGYDKNGHMVTSRRPVGKYANSLNSRPSDFGGSLAGEKMYGGGGIYGSSAKKAGSSYGPIPMPIYNSPPTATPVYGPALPPGYNARQKYKNQTQRLQDSRLAKQFAKKQNRYTDPYWG